MIKIGAGLDKRFRNLWLSHTLFLIVCKILVLVLSFFIIKKTESVIYFTYLALASAIPNIFLLPLLAKFIDKYDIRFTSIVNLIILALSTMLLAYFSKMPTLNILSVCSVFTIISLTITLQSVIFDKAITVLVETNSYSKAIGLVKGATALSYLIAPAISGLLLAKLSVFTVLMASIIFILIHALVISKNIQGKGPGKDENNHLKTNLLLVLQLTFKDSFSRWLLYLYAICFVWMNIANTLSIPILLQNLNTSVTGFVLSLAGLGLLAGNVSLFYLRIKNKVTYLRISIYLLICSQLIFTLSKSTLLMAMALFVGSYFCSIVLGLNQIIVQDYVAYSSQGRFFAIRTAVSFTMMCISYIMAGPIAHYFFKPLLLYNATIHATLVHFLGTGNLGILRFVFLVLSLASLIYLMKDAISVFLAFKKNK